MRLPALKRCAFFLGICLAVGSTIALYVTPDRSKAPNIHVTPARSGDRLPTARSTRLKAPKIQAVSRLSSLALSPTQLDKSDTALPASLVNTSTSATVKTEIGPPVDVASEPLIAYMFGVTSRGLKGSRLHIESQPAFKYALPALVKTASKGFRYVVVMGYDTGDPFYDNPARWEDVVSWFRQKVAEPMEKRKMSCTLHGVGVQNVLKKPGPVFNVIAKKSYALGADYFYRLNDDTELTAPWADLFTSQLKKWGPPYGVVGPHHAGGNTAILVHDFVHRTHMDIFKHMYYPPELVDWWMDDWITHVYGAARTLKIQTATAVHHSGRTGTRYTVDRNNGLKLNGLLHNGSKTVVEYMRTIGHSTAAVVLEAEMYDREGGAIRKMKKYGNALNACRFMLKKHRVQPGKSWGSLSRQDQSIWDELGCNEHSVTLA